MEEQWKNSICPLLEKDFSSSLSLSLCLSVRLSVYLSSSIFCSQSEICVEWYFHFVFGRGQLTISVILVTQPVVRWVVRWSLNVVECAALNARETPLWAVAPRLWSIRNLVDAKKGRWIGVRSFVTLSLFSLSFSLSLSLCLSVEQGSLEGNGYSAALKELTRGVPSDDDAMVTISTCEPSLRMTF